VSAEGTTERESHWQDRQRQRQRQGKCLVGGVALECRVQLQGRGRAGQALWLGVMGLEEAWKRCEHGGDACASGAVGIVRSPL